MIQLKNKEILAQGANRVCYIHPEDPNKILKIIKPGNNTRKKKRQSSWFKKLRPESSFNDNIQEFKDFKWMETHKKDIYRHFPIFYGFEETDLGNALSVELIKIHPEKIESLSMENYLKTYGFTKEILKALDELSIFLYENVIITRDLRAFNILIRYHNNKIQLVIVDGLGNSDFLPLSNYIPFWGRLKIKRKLKRFKEMLTARYGENDWDELKSSLAAPKRKKKFTASE